MVVGAALGGPLSEWVVTVVGWRALFYCQGAVALVWCVAWHLLVSENPARHPRITPQERTHITSSIAAQHAGCGLPVPWGHLFRYSSLTYTGINRLFKPTDPFEAVLVCCVSSISGCKIIMVYGN